MKKMTKAMQLTKEQLDRASKKVIRLTIALHEIEMDLSKNYGQCWDAQDRLQRAQERYDELVERMRDLTADA